MISSGQKREAMEKLMYSPLSCTLEVSLNENSMGKVISASSNVLNVFGRHPGELVENNINVLMVSKMQD